jgi:hypothetical protein
VIRALAALALLSASFVSGATAASTPPSRLKATAAWWEKVTVTIASDGKAQSCKYETSFVPANSKDCDVTGGAGALGASGDAASAANDEYTRLTFERRFQPGAAVPGDGGLQIGDKLLGRQAMSLAIDAAGAVKGCKIVAASGEVTPEYGCDDASSEHFEASAGAPAATPRQGVMTILVYGHAEHAV